MSELTYIIPGVLLLLGIIGYLVRLVLSDRDKRLDLADETTEDLWQAVGVIHSDIAVLKSQISAQLTTVQNLEEKMQQILTVIMNRGSK